MTLGSLERAKDLLLAVVTGIDPCELGFEFAGSGAYRQAYLDPGPAVVYKVDKNRSEESKRLTGYNYSEWIAAFGSMNIFPCPVEGRIARVAQSQLYDFGNLCVMAQEFVPYSSAYSPVEDYHDIIRIQNWFGVSDFHGGNYRIDDAGDIVIVDLGFNSSADFQEKWIECSECGQGHYARQKHTEEDAAAIKWSDVLKVWRNR